MSDAVVELLCDPNAYPHRPVRIEHVQTHISHVFLAGPWVYKLKKPVRFPFLDFSTLAARRHFCAEELRLNRRLAAPVYVDVTSVVRRPDGRLALGSDGELVEPLLRMRRLPADRLLPALLAGGAVDAAMMSALARRIADFHRAAPTGPAVAAHAAPEALRERFAATLADQARFVGSVLPAAEHAFLAAFGERFVRTHEPLLRARQAEGRIREGHGDLHAEHVCFVDAPSEPDPGALPAGVYVFDCIEFSEAFRCNDVASEVAFLAMDLEFRGRRDLADAFVAAYATAAGDGGLAILLPYYAACRAAVRALVACLTSGEDEVAPDERAAARRRAGAYLRLAVRSAWRADPPAIVACCGLSGTGKSALAAELADCTDYVWLRSDVIRRRAGDDRREDRYGPAARTAVYETLTREAEQVLAANRGVIADATFLRRADRDRLAAVAARLGRRIVFLETDAPESVVRARLDARPADDVSEARFDTYLAQRAAREPFGADEPHVLVATDGPVDAARAAALGVLPAALGR
jgi:aminoglycoside phosphotransferase family enzyme/predicted kinase